MAGKNTRKTFRVRRQSRRGASAVAASLTVECALVLPLFFFLLLPLLAFPQALRYQAEENLKLSNEARRLSAVAHVTGTAHWIDLPKRGSYQLPSPALPLPPVRIALRAKVYPFTGYAPGSDDAAGDGAGSGEMVFVTENRSVYHTHADCTHLSLSVYTTSLAAAQKMRNVYGKKYKPCPQFPAGYDGPVYLTEKGEYYYPTPTAASLTRHVRLVDHDSCGDLHLCSRCAARAAGNANTERTEGEATEDDAA